ncbi:interferon-stimulated 20 kDa exonuclease-like 2 [Solea senegalensis]|uniref:Interferon-stimulated 20 kDa exonuclease-like 2 n=1 Tax=Solea senegalensis TaxID=28829 RepID=A0AAV6PTH7_SOLSE|nr:interferon-stimulated 20 kDa exonuclease-like 2 [Solea senegalensis]
MLMCRSTVKGGHRSAARQDDTFKLLCRLRLLRRSKPAKLHDRVNTTAAAAGPSTSSSSSAAIPTKYLAFDCEMVGAGPKGHISQLARCSIVSYDGDVVYDKFIHPSMPVTDYRTRWSGIRRSDLVNATPYTEARKEILKLLMGKVVIGHAVHNDFKVLGYSHPKALTRDTSRIPLLNLKAGFAESECASLKRLTKAIFNRDIQPPWSCTRWWRRSGRGHSPPNRRADNEWCDGAGPGRVNMSVGERTAFYVTVADPSLSSQGF